VQWLQVDPALRHLCVEALAEATPQGARARGLRAKADALSQAAAAATGGADSTAAARRLHAQAHRLLRDACAGILRNVQVVACTCSVAGSQQLEDAGTFRMVIIDEATQATEPATLVPLMRGAECVVLAGDPQQLPPTVTTLHAAQLGLDRCAACMHALPRRRGAPCVARPLAAAPHHAGSVPAQAQRGTAGVASGCSAVPLAVCTQAKQCCELARAGEQACSEEQHRKACSRIACM
jgi:hypothetical protein